MKIEEILEKVVFKSRWILAPMYLGLVGVSLMFVCKIWARIFSYSYDRG